VTDSPRAGRIGRVGRSRSDQGSASLAVALWIVVLVLLGAAGAVLGSVLAARADVTAAADLGALAGASAALDGETAACRRAAIVVDANGASLRSCRSTGAEVWVVAEGPAPAAVAWLLDGRSGSLVSRAHAELVARAP
jgi:secretion/DNA translocation related TadE-like protein